MSNDARIFRDAITGYEVTIENDTLSVNKEAEACSLAPATSVFFPGCAMVNASLPIVEWTYETLVAAGSADGISFLCCGLPFAFDSPVKQEDYRRRFKAALAEAGVKRILPACPNCDEELRRFLPSGDGNVAIVSLPKALQSEAHCSSESKGCIAFHDSCPDRAWGVFGTSVRAMYRQSDLSEIAHHGDRSTCCGADLLFAGKREEAFELARVNGVEASEADADYLGTYCFRCAKALATMQSAVPVRHYLEDLSGIDVDWRAESGSELCLSF